MKSNERLENLDKLEEIESKLTHIHGDRNEMKLRVIGWIILIFTVISITTLALVSGYVSFKEMSEGSSGMPAGIPLSLKYALALFISTLISLAIVVALTSIYFWRPMKEHLQVRKSNIETNIDAASYTRQVAESEWLKAREAKKQVKEEGKEIISQFKTQADKERKSILEQTKKEQNLLIEKSREQIEKEKEQLRDDIRKEILSTSLLAAEKIIEKELNSDANEKMINELLNSLKE